MQLHGPFRDTGADCGAVPPRSLLLSLSFPPFAAAREGSAMAERLPPAPAPVIFCQDSPKRVLVSVIKTTPIKPSSAGSGTEEPMPVPPVPTSPGFSDFMVYPWRWGENAHNVTLSPGGGDSTAGPSALPPPRGGAGRVPGGDEEKAGNPGSGGRHRHLKVRARRAGAGGPRACGVTPRRAPLPRFLPGI